MPLPTPEAFLPQIFLLVLIIDISVVPSGDDTFQIPESDEFRDPLIVT